MNKRPSSFNLSRRQILQGAAAAGIASLGSPAWAQSKGRIVVGTSGGDYEHLISKYIEQPILNPAGWDTIHDVGTDLDRRSKVIAGARLPRGTTDIQALSALFWYQMSQAGVLKEIDYGRLKNAANLLPSMKYPFGVATGFTAAVPLYNPNLVETPMSYKDVLDPKHGNKLGLIDIQHQYVMSAATMAAGGKLDDLEAGKKLLLELRKAGVRIYPTNEAFAQALKSEEISIGIMWKARAVQWQNAGISVKASVPSEGALKFVLGYSIPKNAVNKDGAYAFLDAALEKSAQEAFATTLGYPPTVTNAALPPELIERIGFTQEQLNALVDLDYAYLTQNEAALRDWWDRSFKG
ncbi:extracellular solute-binding protein [Agrobacterium rhizogenes]|uniref:ABC transporter substrate-binding protein n=1 Tax=Rhizobium rhizogenes TaxID=359 RepID=UPI0015717846|nr:extracellular solute-binding protein [Rhizobium rhizogenes]NTH16742.1 extracellular solute-binding protein [Rhizobium rhizogenes]